MTLDELIDDIGVDATRWFLLQRSHDTTLDVDLELARSQSQDNPVYYAQYAHARIASILRKAGEERVQAALAADVASSPEHLHPSARALVKRLLELPGEVDGAADAASPAPDHHLRDRVARRRSRPSTATARSWVRPRRAATRTCGSRSPSSPAG